jgi:hypothetical protein
MTLALFGQRRTGRRNVQGRAYSGNHRPEGRLANVPPASRYSTAIEEITMRYPKYLFAAMVAVGASLGLAGVANATKESVT